MGLNKFKIRETTTGDLNDIMVVEEASFETDKEARIAAELLKDETARPLISLLAFDGEKPVGHIMFSKAKIESYQKREHVHLLSPLAVIPEYQKQGIGGLLIKEGIKKLKEKGTEMVFVLGDPDYFRRHGFIPMAEDFGYTPPFPITKSHSEAWMVKPLTNLKGLSKSVGKVMCADSLNKPEIWKK